MLKNHVITALMKLYTEDEVQVILRAVLQNSLICDELNQDGFQRIISVLPRPLSVSMWNPATIALISQDLDINLSQDLKTKSLKEINPDLASESIIIHERILVQKNHDPTLKDALNVAFVLNDKLNEDSKIGDLFNRNVNYTSVFQEKSVEFWGCVFACLLNFQKDPNKILGKIMLEMNNQEFIEIISNAILSNPLQSQELIGSFIKVFSNQKLEIIIRLLDHLNRSGWQKINKEIAKEIINQHPEFCLPTSEIKKSIKPLNWIDVHGVTYKIQQIALLKYYAGMNQDAFNLFEIGKEILVFQNECLEKFTKQINDPQINEQNYDEFALLTVFPNQKTQVSLGEIKKLIEHNQVSEAARQITGLRKIKKANHIVYRTAAEISCRLGDFSHALDEIITAISLEPNDSESKIIAGRIYHSINDDEKGFSLLQSDKGILENISNNDLYLFLDIAIHAKEYETVIGICVEKTEEKNDSQLYSFLAEAQIGLKRNIQALSSLKKAVEIDRGNPKAWLLLAKLEIHGGDAVKATEALVTGLKYCPNSQKIYIELIKRLNEQKSKSSVEKYLSEAVQLSPENISEVIELAELVNTFKYVDDALFLVNRAMQQWPLNNQLKIFYAELLLENSRFAESQTLLRELMQTDEFDEEGLQTYFYALIGSSKVNFPFKGTTSNLDIPEIKRVITILQKLFPESLWIQMFNAEIANLENHIDESINIYSDLLKGLENVTQDMRWRIQAGMAGVQMVKGEFESAIAILNEIICVKKDLPEIYFLLTDVYEKKGLHINAYENAIEVMERFPLTQKNLNWFKSTLIQIGKLSRAIDEIKIIHLSNNEKEFLKLFLSCNPENINITRELIYGFLSVNSLKSNQAVTIANQLAQIDDLDKAIEILSIIKDDKVENNSINFSLACLLRNSRRPTEATLALDSSSHLIAETYRPYLYLELAIFMHDQEKIEKAFSEIERKPTLLSSNLEELLDSTDFDFHLLPECWREIICAPETVYALAAEEYYKSGNIPKSVELLKKAKIINPENIKIKWMLAEISKSFLLNGYEDNSTIDLIKIEYDEKQKEYFVNLSCLKAEIAFSKNEDVLAASIVSKILLGNEENLRLKGLQARLFYREGDLPSANQLIKEVENAISIPTPENKFQISDFISDCSWLIEAALDLENWDLAQKHISIALRADNPSPFIILMTIKYLCQMEIFNDLCYEVFAKNHLVEIGTLKQQLYSTIDNPEKNTLQEYPIIDEWKRILKAIENLSWGEIQNKVNYENAEVLSYISRKNDKNEELSRIVDQFNDNFGVLLQASLQIWKNDLLKSVFYIDKTISMNPSNPISFTIKAMVLEKNDKTEEALIAIENALSFWSNEPEWHTLAATLHGKMGNNNREISHLESAYQLDPHNSEIRKTLLNKYFKSGDFENSANLIRDSGDISTRTFEESIILAEINLRNHLYKEAYELGMEAIRKEPGSSQPYLLLARMAIELKNHKKAQNYLRKVFASSPQNPDAHLIMAQIIEESGGIGEALKYLENNSQGIQGEQQVIVRKAEYINKIRGADESRKYLMQFESKDFPNVLTNLALMEIESGLCDEADRHAQNSLNKNSNQPILISALGTMYRKQGNLDKSLKYYLDALKLEPKTIEHYINLSEIYLQRREQNKVIDILKQGIERFPNEMRLYQLAGKIYWGMKDYLNAEDMFRYAAEINPNDNVVHRQLGAVMSINLIHQKQKAN